MFRLKASPYPSEGVVCTVPSFVGAGHASPEEGQTYRGFASFARAHDWSLQLLDYSFEGLNGSRWLEEALKYIGGALVKKRGVVCLFEGTLRNYEFNGQVTTVCFFFQ